MRAAIASLVLLLCACHRGGGRGRAPAPAEGAVMGAESPAGDRHPGRLVQEDRVNKRTWTDAADAVPQSIAWAERDGKWVPAVRIVVDGTASVREVTRFGPAGEVLDRTMMTAAKAQ